VKFRFEGAVFDLVSSLRYLGLRDQALFVFLHLDTLSVHAVRRGVLVFDIMTVIFVIAQQPLLLPLIFLLHFLDHLSVQLVFNKSLRVETLMNWKNLSIL